MDNFIAVVRALSDENRLRALLMLRDGEICACRIMEILGLAASTVSTHMAILQRAGLVEVRKDGKWRHYRLPGKGAPPLARKAIALLKETLSDEPAAVEDGRKVRKLLADCD